MKILICGHSFISRYRREHLINQIPLADRKGRFTDFSHCFGLPGHHQVFVNGRGGLCLDSSGIDFITDNINYVNPELLLLEIGSNDICDNNVTVTQLERQLVRVTREIFSVTGVKYIIICQVVQRRRTRACSTFSFEEKRAQLNFLLQQLARKESRVYVYRHDRSILVNLSNRISGDDIHVTTGRGFELYHFSIRRALMVAIRKMENLT